MRKLPTEYKQAGEVYRLVKRKGNAVMFKALGSESYEVFRVRIFGAAKLPGGRTREPGEYAPGTSVWGDDAWTCIGEDRAKARFRQLVETQDADSRSMQPSS